MKEKSLSVKNILSEPDYEKEGFVTWPLPEAMKKLIAARNPQIHDVMVASGSELNVLGNLKTVDVTPQLSILNVPVLITCGSDDLCTPDYSKWQAGLAKDAEFYVMQDGAHMTPMDKPIELIKIQTDFLSKIENLAPFGRTFDRIIPLTAGD